jgi:hypothetical protein
MNVALVKEKESEEWWIFCMCCFCMCCGFVDNARDLLWRQKYA